MRFNFQIWYVLFGSLHSQNSDHFPAQRSLIGFYNRDGECLLRGKSNSVFKAVPWLSHSVDGLTPRTLRFYRRPVHVSFVVVNMALAKVFLRVTGFLFCQYGPNRVP
jgi:hypothetical protein